MKKIFFFLTLFVGLQSFAQQFMITGKVANENKEALPNASILVKETKIGTSTNFDGKFSIKLTKGTYTLVFSYLGYNSVTKVITITKNEDLSITLSPNNTMLDEVLVSAVRVNADIPVTFSNLSKKEIAKRNLGQDIPILMNYLPNVVSSSDAGAGIGYTYMNVRGSNSERINVTINGIPYNDAESQGTFWVNLGDFASSTESLQLQRGVGTSTNGAAAFGASLNILTDAVSEESYGEIANSFGSFGTRKHTIKFSTGKINDRIEIAGRLSNIYSDGYVDRAFADLKSYFLQATYSDDNTLIKAITFGGKERTYQAWFGLTAEQLEEDRRQNPYTYDNEVDDYQQDHFQFHWNEQWSEKWSTNLGLNYTKGAGFFEQFGEEEDAADFANLIEDESDVIVRRWLDNDFYVVNFNANYQNENINFITGISYSNYTGDHFGEVIWGSNLAPNISIRDRYYFSDATKNDFSIFAKANFSLSENLSAYADLQGRFISYQTEGITNDIVPINIDRNFNFFNPKFGLTYKLNASNNLYASFAIANREPNRNDFENGVNDYETLQDLEVGWRFKSENVKLNANTYYMNYKNQLVLTGAIDDVGQPIRATSGSSYRLGLELDAEITLSNKFMLRPNASFSQNKNRDFFITRDGIEEPQALGNTNLSFSPNVVIGNMFVYNASNNLQFTFLSKYVGEQFMSNFSSAISTTDILDSFFINDLNIVYQIKPKNIFTSITFTALVNNIFNVEYVDRGYYFTFIDDYSNPGTEVTVDGAGYYPQATRNFLIGATLRF